jgi:hypothetical protein
MLLVLLLDVSFVVIVAVVVVVVVCAGLSSSSSASWTEQLPRPPLPWTHQLTEYPQVSAIRMEDQSFDPFLQI